MCANNDINTINNMRIDLMYYKALLDRNRKDYAFFNILLRIKKRIESLSKYPADRILERKQYKFIEQIQGHMLNKDDSRKRKIIVSVTSYPKRIEKCAAALASMFQQTMKPDKIVLWLGKDEFPDKRLPKTFDNLKKAGLEVRFRKDIGVHTRWYYGMKEFSEDLVIILDDDIIYKDFIVEKLYNSYLRHPDCVSAMAYLTMRFDENEKLRAYGDWFTSGSTSGRPSFRFTAIEVGGTLYPPGLLPEETFDLDDILKLSPKQDDLWLKCMEVINGVKVAPAQKQSIIHGTVIRGTQRGLALGTSNMTENGNDRQMENILDKYNRIDDATTITGRIMSDCV